jgi:AAA domain
MYHIYTMNTYTPLLICIMLILYTAEQAGHPFAVLTEQYRMHTRICAWPSARSYSNELVTAPTTAAARQCIKPCVWLDVTGAEVKHQQQVSGSYHVKLVDVLHSLHVAPARVTYFLLCVTWTVLHNKRSSCYYMPVATEAECITISLLYYNTAKHCRATLTLRRHRLYWM